MKHRRLQLPSDSSFLSAGIFPTDSIVFTPRTKQTSQFFGDSRHLILSRSQLAIHLAVLLCVAVSPVSLVRAAGNDVQKVLIKSREHDFGTVARGSKTVHDFKLFNSFQQPIEIAEARSSCGCTKATVPSKVVQPGEWGVIRAEFNTRSFLGKKSATITVVLNVPVRREIQLRVTGNIRGDVVLEPGELTIQNIKQGESRSVSTQIHYAGKPTWQIVDVRSSLGFLIADLIEVERTQGSVKYRLTVTLQGDFPEGQIRDSLTLVTNDKNQKLLPLAFTARVVSPLRVSPQQLEVPKGDSIQKRLILKSDQPFGIAKVDTGDKRIQVRYREGVRKTQLVTLSFQPLHGVPFSDDVSIRIETNLGKSYTQTVRVRFID